MSFVRRSGAVQRPERGLIAYSASLCVLALLAFGLFVIEGMRFGNPWILACLAIVAVVAERASLRLNDTTEISISLLPTLFAGVLFGPLAALIVGAASNLLDIYGDPCADWRRGRCCGASNASCAHWKSGIDGRSDSCSGFNGRDP